VKGSPAEALAVPGPWSGIKTGGGAGPSIAWRPVNGVFRRTEQGLWAIFL